MPAFEMLMTRARTFQKNESDPTRVEWWAGYITGLRHHQHGENFGNVEQHKALIALAGNPDRLCDARGRGYQAGCTGEARYPG